MRLLRDAYLLNIARGVLLPLLVWMVKGEIDPNLIITGLFTVDVLHFAAVSYFFVALLKQCRVSKYAFFPISAVMLFIVYWIEPTLEGIGGQFLAIPLSFFFYCGGISYMAWDENGDLIFHGRKDHMVKVRGYRVELDEVRRAAARFEGIEEAACVPVQVNGGDHICCYYTGREASPEALKAFIGASLPEYMLPEYCVHLDALPRNDRNKVDFQALKALEIRTEEADYEPPETELEKTICRVFAETLEMERASGTADFFACGGTSLSAAVLISHLSEDYTVSFQDISAHPTPRKLAAFLPFIPEYPDDRIDFCLEDGACPLLLSTKRQMEGRALQAKGCRVLTLEEAFQVENLEEIRPDTITAAYPNVAVSPENLAYCIYTSGSTGRPKGVMIEHRNIMNYVHRNEKSLEIMHYASPGRVNLALASFSFDVSVVEELVPLCNGNTVIIATEAEIHDPALFARLVKETGADGITCTPTYLLSLLEIPESREAIRQFTFFDIGAEAFPRQLYDRLRELRQDSVILNVYGPTECTMGCAAALKPAGSR